MAETILELPEAKPGKPEKDPLSFCREKKYEELFHMMDERRKIPNWRVPYNYKPSTRQLILCHAIKHGDVQVVRKLVDIYGCDPCYSEKYSDTPLQCAASHGNIDIVKYFVINKGIRPPLVNDRSNALNCVCFTGRPTHGHVEVLKFLLNYGWKLHYVDKKPPSIPPDADFLLRVALKYREPKKEHDSRYCALKLLLSQGDISDVRSIFEQGHLMSLTQLEDQFTTYPELTSYITDTDTVNYLVKKGMFTVTPELIKSYRYSPKIIKDLVKNCSENVFTTSLESVRGQGYHTLLDHACQSNNLALMKAIADGNINSKDTIGRAPLHVACKHDRLLFVIYLTECSSDLNVLNSEDQLPLHVAAAHSGIQVVKLVSSCAVNRQDALCNTPLHLACKRVETSKKDDAELYDDFDDGCFDYDDNYFFGVHRHQVRALSKYVSPNDRAAAFDIVEHLVLDKNCSLDIYNKCRELPLHTFITILNSDDTESFSKMIELIIKILDSASHNVINMQDYRNNTLLHLACSAGSVDLVRHLVLEKQCDISVVNRAGNLPLHIACKRKSLELVKLVSTGISQELLLHENNRGQTALHLACEDTSHYLPIYETERKLRIEIERKKIAKYLVFDMGCKPVDNPHKFHRLSITFACADENDFELLSALATKRNSFNLHSMLLAACSNNNIKAVRHLANLYKQVTIFVHHRAYLSRSRGYDYDSDSDYYDSSYESLLHIASTKSAEMVDLIAQWNLYSDVNACTSSTRNTPLHLACEYNMIDVVQLLTTKYDCDQFVHNYNKELPLHLACARSLSLVKLLKVNSKFLQEVTCEGYTPLHIACEHDKLEIALYLISKHDQGDISSLVTHDTFHPLQLACKTGNVQIVKCLIENEGNTFSKAVDGNTPLHIACSSGSVEVVQYLIDNNHDIKAFNSKQQLPLHIACTKSLEMVKLTSYKCTAKELESKTTDDVTALHIATSCGLLEVVQYLVEVKNCSVFTLDYYGNNALVYACGYNGHRYSYSNTNSFFPCIARYLVQQGCNPTEKFSKYEYDAKTPIGESIKCKSLDLLKALVDHKMNINCQNEVGNTPLMLLCKSIVKESQSSPINQFYLDSIEYLISRDCHQHIFNEDGELALHFACASMHNIMEVIELLDCSFSTLLGCSYAAVKNKNGDAPLHIACQNHKLEVLRHMWKFCDAKQFDVQNGKGLSLLHIAVINGNTDIVRFLLTEVKEVCSTLKDADGAAPVHYARDEEILKLLLEHDDKNVHLCTDDGNTLLHIITLYRSYDTKGPLHLRLETKEIESIGAVIQCLLANGASFRVKNNDGDTPLHIACDTPSSYRCDRKATAPTTCECSRNIQCIFDFIAHLPEDDSNYIEEADDAILIQNNCGNTPLHIACLRRNFCVVNVLYKSSFKCDLTAKNSSGDTPFHIACTSGCFPIIDYLLDTQRDCVDVLAIRNNHGDLPFHVVLEFLECDDDHTTSSRNTLQFFAKNCYDTNAKNYDDESLLHLACKVKNHFNLGLVKFFLRSATASRQSLLFSKPESIINWQDVNGNTPVHVACINGQYQLALFMLKEEGYLYIPNVRNKSNQTPLHCTCASLSSRGNSGTFQSLVHRAILFGDNPNLPDNDGNTPLHLLVKGKITRLVKAYLRCRIGDISRQNNLGETALHIACKEKHPNLELVRCLLDCDPTCKLKDQPCDTALHLACRNYEYNLDVVQCLVESKHAKAAAVPNALGELPIHLICCKSNRSFYSLECIKILCSYCHNLDYQTISGDTLLHFACTNSSDDVISYLVEEAHCSVLIPNNEGDLPLHIACRKRRYYSKTIGLLVNKENVNAQNDDKNTALHEVCMQDRSYQLVQPLIGRGAKLDIPNTDGRYPIHLACMFQSSLEAIELLQPCGLAVKTKDGSTVLHEACRNTTHSSNEIIQYLLDYKPELDLTAVNSDGDLALHVACRNRNLTKCVERLIKDDSNINLTNKNGNSPLHELMKTGASPELVLQLLKHKPCNITISNVNKENLLLLACKSNLTTVVNYLLTEKASEMCQFVHLKDCNGNTPIMLTDKPEIVRILLNNGADPGPLYEMHKAFFDLYGSDSPPETPVNFLVIGHPCAGKTTLISSLKKENEDSKTETLARTAGIIPSNFNSDIYGQVTMYDFAGQPEYYASHDAVIHSTIKNSPPIVLLVVDLTHRIQDITKVINYWSTFIKNRLTSLSDRAHLYVVCSHADVIEQKGGDPQSKSKALLTAIEDNLHSITILEFKKLLAMNCTDPQSQTIGKLRALLAQSTKQLRHKGVLNFRSHCLSTFLNQTFKDEVVL